MPVLTPRQLETKLFEEGPDIGRGCLEGRYSLKRRWKPKLTYSPVVVQELVGKLTEFYDRDGHVILGTDGRLYRTRLEMPQGVEEKRTVEPSERGVRGLMVWTYDFNPDDARAGINNMIERAGNAPPADTYGLEGAEE